MREDVRIQAGRPDPDRSQRGDCRKANIKLRRSDDRRWTRILTAARGDQADGANMLTAICVGVNPRM